MPIEITMPRLSDTMEQGTIVKWHVAQGDTVESGDVLADVETDKATMEMQAYDDGTITDISVSEGQPVSIGTVVAMMVEEGEEVGERAGDEPLREGRQAGDAQMADPASANALRGFLDPQHPLMVVLHHKRQIARIGGRHEPALGAVEQQQPGGVLQLLDRAGDRRLGGVEHARGRRRRPEVEHGGKGVELCGRDFHRPISNLYGLEVKFYWIWMMPCLRTPVREPRGTNPWPPGT